MASIQMTACDCTTCVAPLPVEEELLCAAVDELLEDFPVLVLEGEPVEVAVLLDVPLEEDEGFTPAVDEEDAVEDFTLVDDEDAVEDCTPAVDEDEAVEDFTLVDEDTVEDCTPAVDEDPVEDFTLVDEDAVEDCTVGVVVLPPGQVNT